MPTLDANHQLDELVRGAVLRPGEEGYAEHVAGFNLATTHTPELVVAATSAADVAATVGWAAAAGLPVGVQATGHGANVAVDRGVLISTRLMADISVDAAARTATVAAGVRWRDLLAAAAPHGLIGLNGSTSGVGVVGYTLGGGLPVLGRAFGWASDYVRDIEVVTGDGTLRRVNAEREPELFWALRGGKGNVGIVTSMTLDLLPTPALYGGAIFYPGGHAAAVLAAYRDWTTTVPESMCTALTFLRLPPLPDVPEPLRGKFAVQLCVASVASADEAAAALAPMRAAAPALMEMVGPMDYADVDRIYNDPDHPVPAIEGGMLLAGLDSAAADAVLHQAGPDSACPLGIVQLRHMGGALARPARVPDAVCGRDAAFACYAIGIPMPEVAPLIPGAMAGLFAALEPHSTGCSLVNMHGTPGDAADRARPWTAETFARLQSVRAGFDPAELFRFGHAIPAAAV